MAAEKSHDPRLGGGAQDGRPVVSLSPSARPEQVPRGHIGAQGREETCGPTGEPGAEGADSSFPDPCALFGPKGVGDARARS